MSPINLDASLSQASAILLVLGADIFKKIAVRYKHQCSFDGKGAGVIQRVIEDDLQIHVAEIATAIPLGDVHGFAAGMAGDVEPGPIVHADGVNDKRIGLPMSNGISHPSWIRILRQRTPVGVNLARRVEY